MLEYAGICSDMVGYVRIWGYDGIWWDMLGYGGMCEGGGSACGEKALHMLCKGFSVVPHGFYICLESFLN